MYVMFIQCKAESNRLVGGRLVGQGWWQADRAVVGACGAFANCVSLTLLSG